MITLNDVKTITISSSCDSVYPCEHNSKIILKDGRSAANLTCFEICSIISNLAKEKIITDSDKWTYDEVIEHFKEYSESDMGYIAESPEVVLNTLFPK